MSRNVPDRMNVDVVARWFNKFTPEERLEFMDRLNLAFKSRVVQAFDAFERWSDGERVELLDLIEDRYCMRCGALLLEGGECVKQREHDEEDDRRAEEEAREEEDGDDGDDGDGEGEGEGAEEDDAPASDPPDSEEPPDSGDDGEDDEDDEDDDGFDDTQG